MTASTLHKNLLAAGKQKIDREIEIQTLETDLREKFAELMGLTDKDGVNVKPSLVKMPLFKAAIALVHESAPDKKEEEYQIYRKYVTALENEKRNASASINALVKRYLRAKDRLTAIKEEIKEIKNEALTTEEEGVALEKEDVAKVEALVEIPLEEHKESAINKMLEEQGKPPKKAKVVMTLEELIAFAEKNGIEVKLNS